MDSFRPEAAVIEELAGIENCRTLGNSGEPSGMYMAKKLPDNERIASNEAVWDFRQRWTDHPTYKAVPGDIIQLRVRVKFLGDGSQLADETTILRLSTNAWNGGQIDLDEVGDLRDTFLHLRYVPDFVRCTFRPEDGALAIEGRGSPKFSRYTVC